MRQRPFNLHQPHLLHNPKSSPCDNPDSQNRRHRKRNGPLPLDHQQLFLPRRLQRARAVTRKRGQHNLPLRSRMEHLQHGQRFLYTSDCRKHHPRSAPHAHARA